jgi:nucleoid-associated protein YgaU
MALTKAVIVRIDAPGTPPIPVMFNPPRYALSSSNRFAEIRIPGLPAAVMQFVGGEARSLSLELFFDTTMAPPRLLMLWGSLAFPGYLVSVKQTFDHFSAFGLPLRATLAVEFKGYEPTPFLTTAGLSAALTTAELATRYVVKAGDTLQSIAAALYGDPNRWREIATANGLDDPRALPTGRQLEIRRRP